MNRRGFLRGVLATVALTTGLARARLDLRDGPGFEHERDYSSMAWMIAQKTKELKRDMELQILSNMWNAP